MGIIRSHRRGSATLEFTLVGIPLMFMLISIFEMARGMWTYHTLAYAVKEGTRYAVVHGQNSSSHATYQSICNRIVSAGTGLISQDLAVSFTSGSFTSASSATGPYCAGSSCANGFSTCPTTSWPPSGEDHPGQYITVSAYYPFVSALSMFWPGKTKGLNFKMLTCTGGSTVCLPAASSDAMQY